MKINSNIQDFINMVEGRSKHDSGQVQYAYVAGYYESVLGHLSKDIPGVAEYLAQRVKYVEGRTEA